MRIVYLICQGCVLLEIKQRKWQKIGLKSVLTVKVTDFENGK